jgi:hypothetical protein
VFSVAIGFSIFVGVHRRRGKATMNDELRTKTRSRFFFRVFPWLISAYDLICVYLRVSAAD